MHSGCQADGSPGSPALWFLPGRPLFGRRRHIPPSAVSAATLLSKPNLNITSDNQRTPAIDDPGFDPNSHYTRYRQYYERGTNSPQRDFLPWPSQKSVVHDVQLGRPRRFRRLLARLAITSPQGRPQPPHRSVIDRFTDFRRFRQAIRRSISPGVFSNFAPRQRADHPHPDSRRPCLNAARSPAITTPSIGARQPPSPPTPSCLPIILRLLKRLRNHRPECPTRCQACRRL